MIAIDPGDKHCGIAGFVDDTCVRAATLSPDQLVRYLERTREGLWVVEEFKLYPWKAQQQAYSEMKTSKLIGVIEYLADRRERSLIEQPAYVKKVAKGHLRSVGIPLLAGDTHAQDAQLHGWFHLLKTKGGVGA